MNIQYILYIYCHTFTNTPQHSMHAFLKWKSQMWAQIIIFLMHTQIQCRYSPSSFLDVSLAVSSPSALQRTKELYGFVRRERTC